MSCVAQPAMAQTLPSMRSRRFEAHTKLRGEYDNGKGAASVRQGWKYGRVLLLHKHLFLSE